MAVMVRSFLRTRLDTSSSPFIATISSSFASRQTVLPLSTTVRPWQDEQPLIVLTFVLFDLSSVLRSMKGRRFWLVDALLCMRRFADGSLFGDGGEDFHNTENAYVGIPNRRRWKGSARGGALLLLLCCALRSRRRAVPKNKANPARTDLRCNWIVSTIDSASTER